MSANTNTTINTTASPQHPPPLTAAAAASLQEPGGQRGQSPSSSHRSLDQSRSRASTRQSHLSSSSTPSDWTSASALPQPSAPPSLKPYFYPTSGYPISGSILQHSYPSSGYPVSHLHHSYGYPANNFPCCEVPGVTDLGSRLMYPSSEFPGGGWGGGVFPGEIDQDDGSAPFISGLPPDPSAAFGGDPAGFPGDHLSPLPASDSVYTPGSYDSPYYHPGYPI